MFLDEATDRGFQSAMATEVPAPSLSDRHYDVGRRAPCLLRSLQNIAFGKVGIGFIYEFLRRLDMFRHYPDTGIRVYCIALILSYSWIG